MSKPIVVGYDPRRPDRAPVDFGAAAARLTRAPLIIVAVEAGAPHLPFRPEPATADEDLVADAAEALSSLTAELTAAGVQADCRRIRGPSAARALHDFAEQEDAGLLVVGSSRESALGNVLPGSTAQRLLHGAPCPITVVPHGWAPGNGLRAIGVGYVDTDEGREALRGAHALARQAGATLRVIAVVKFTPLMYAEIEASIAGQAGKDLEDVEGEHRLAVDRAVRATVAELGRDVAVEVDTVIGEPAETLVAMSEHLDLLVCGSRGYGPMRAVLLGSVSRRVIEEARCPVTVLPRGVEASLDALMDRELAARS